MSVFSYCESNVFHGDWCHFECLHTASFSVWALTGMHLFIHCTDNFHCQYGIAAFLYGKIRIKH